MRVVGDARARAQRQERSDALANGLEVRRLAAIGVASEVLCRRWKPRLLWLLAAGCRRYTQLASRLPGISPKVLSQLLRELEREGIVDRHTIADRTKRVEYLLTPLGEDLRPLLRELEAFGHELQRARSPHPSAVNEVVFAGK